MRASKASSSASATRQLRTSPGGSMPKSERKRPLEPPSSITDTTAVRLWISAMVLIRPRVTWCLRPRKSVDRPVPPPKHTTRKGACNEVSAGKGRTRRRGSTAEKPDDMKGPQGNKPPEASSRFAGSGPPVSSSVYLDESGGGCVVRKTADRRTAELK